MVMLAIHKKMMSKAIYMPWLFFKRLFFTDDGFALGIGVDTGLADKAVLWPCVLAGGQFKRKARPPAGGNAQISISF